MKRRSLAASAFVALVCLAACAPDPDTDTHQGIAVGNPGVVAMSLAEADGFALSLAELPVDRVGFAACDGADRIDAAAPADLAQGPLLVDFPAGSWCGVVVFFDGPARIDATWNDGVDSGLLAASLDLTSVMLEAVDGPLVVDEDTTLALELASPDWLDPQALGLVPGETTTIGPDDSAHDLLVAAIASESALFEDLDASGLVDLPERDAGAVALPGEIALDPGGGAGADAVSLDSEAGCGCATSGSSNVGSLAVLLLAALLLGTRRRHTARRDP